MAKKQTTKTKPEAPRWYLRIDKTFFQRLEVRKLKRDHPELISTYLNLCIYSLSDNCNLIFYGIEDTPEAEWALAIEEDPENVRIVVELLKKMRLLQLTEDTDGIKVFTLKSAAEFAKSETKAAERMRRMRSNAALNSDSDVTRSYADVTPMFDDVTNNNSNSQSQNNSQKNSNSLSRVIVNSHASSAKLTAPPTEDKMLQVFKDEIRKTGKTFLFPQDEMNKFYQHYFKSNSMVGDKPVQDWEALARAWVDRALKPKIEYDEECGF